jgi:hypothetical protein
MSLLEHRSYRNNRSFTAGCFSSAFVRTAGTGLWLTIEDNEIVNSENARDIEA